MDRLLRSIEHTVRNYLIYHNNENGLNQERVRGTTLAQPGLAGDSRSASLRFAPLGFARAPEAGRLEAWMRIALLREP